MPSRATSSRELAAEIEETIWERLHFASHLRTERLGEFTIGTELHRSESLALVQLLILYHLVTARRRSRSAARARAPPASSPSRVESRGRRRTEPATTHFAGR